MSRLSALLDRAGPATLALPPGSRTRDDSGARLGPSALRSAPVSPDRLPLWSALPLVDRAAGRRTGRGHYSLRR